MGVPLNLTMLARPVGAVTPVATMRFLRWRQQRRPQHHTQRQSPAEHHHQQPRCHALRHWMLHHLRLLHRANGVAARCHHGYSSAAVAVEFAASSAVAGESVVALRLESRHAACHAPRRGGGDRRLAQGVMVYAIRNVRPRAKLHGQTSPKLPKKGKIRPKLPTISWRRAKPRPQGGDVKGRVCGRVSTLHLVHD